MRAMPRTVLAWLLALSATFAGLGLWLAGRQSATTDEVAHIGAGYAYLSGDFRLNREHPPLLKLLAALAMPRRSPALSVPRQGDPDVLQWRFGNVLLHEADQPPEVLLAGARAPSVLLAMWLVPLAGAFALRVAGALAACVAGVLAAFSPLWLAHGTLVTTDAGSALCVFGAAYLALELIEAESQRRRRWLSLGLGLVTGLGFAVKYSSAVGLAGVTVAALWDSQRRGALRALAPTLLIATAGGALLGIGCAWGWPPAPARYLDGVSRAGLNHLQGYPVYAFGELSLGAHPLYFVRALAVKVSASVLLLALLSPLSRLGAVAARPARSLPSLTWLPALVHLVVFCIAAPALSVRYVLPTLPFLFLQAAVAAERLWRRPRLRWSVPVLVALHLGSAFQALQQSPLAFFNGLGCYTGQLPPCLDDSNVDWGQGLIALRSALRDEASAARVRVFYVGSSQVSAYVPDAVVATPAEILKPYRALYAVSLHLLARSPRESWVRAAPARRVVAGVYALFDLREVSALSPPP